MARERSRGRLSPRRGREKRDSRPIGIEAQFADAIAGVAATTFLGLLDTPASYGTAGFVVAVNGTSTGLVFQAAGVGDMLLSVFDPASIGEQLVGVTAVQTLTNKTLTTAFLLSSLVLDSGGPNDYTVLWDTPAADRTLTIPDPLGSDEFVFKGMIQTLENKVLIEPTIASFVNAEHTHLSPSSGGVLPDITLLKTFAWVTGAASAPFNVSETFLTMPLDTVQEESGAFSLSAGELTPPVDGAYVINTTTAWDASSTAQASAVDVVWQVFDTILGQWTDILGHN